MDEKKKMDPVKKQVSLFHFKGFKRSGSPIDQPKISNECNCAYCGQLFLHGGAKQMHEHWCKKNPNRNKVSPSYKCDDPKSIVVSILDDLLTKICDDTQKLAPVFKRPSYVFEERNIEPIKAKENEASVSKIFTEENHTPKKKTRTAYSFTFKAQVVEKYLTEKANDNNVTQVVIADGVAIQKWDISKWLKQKDYIYQMASEEKLSQLKKGYKSKRHQKTFPLLYQEFLNMRKTGRKVCHFQLPSLILI